MKNKFLSLAAAALLCTSASATSIWSGNHPVDWSNTFTVAAEQFANAQEGNKLTFTLTVNDGASDAIELKSNGQKLPGTRFSATADWWTTYEVFMTQDMIDTCKVYGMEVCGTNFTVTNIELEDGKAGNMKEGKTIWTGYFWVDSWSTLEVFKEAFTAVKDYSPYKGIRFYHENASTDYLIFLLDDWNEENGYFGKSEPANDSISAINGNCLKRYENYAELNLAAMDVALLDRLANVDRMMLQMDKQGSAAFNFTDIVLVTELTPTEEEPETAVENTVVSKATKVIKNGMIVIVKDGVEYNALGVKL